MPDVEIAAGVLACNVVGILRQAGAVSKVPVRAHIVQRMRVRVTRHHAQTMVVARIQGDLQPVVV